LLGTAGKGYLSWEFGWKPLLSDLRKMCNFASIVEKRKEELRKLLRNGGIRRRYYYGRDVSASAQKDVVICSTPAIVKATISQDNSRESWAVLRWVPTLPEFILRDDSALTKLAWQRVLSLSRGQTLSNVWEGLPWSWLVDWFTNTGDFLVAADNSVATVFGGVVNVMTHTTSKETISVTSAPSWVSYATRVGLWETKERFVVSGTSLTASMPFLSGRQLAILSSIWAVKTDLDRYKRNYRR